jgi:predicted ATPase
MLFSSLRIQGYRSIDDSGTLELGPITLFIGRNNSGKSAVLRALYMLQEGSQVQNEDIRIGATRATAKLTYDEIPTAIRKRFPSNRQPSDGPGEIEITLNDGQQKSLVVRGEQPETTSQVIPSLASREPHNLIFPVLSGRRVTYYQEQVSQDNSLNVSPQDSNLVSRVLPLTASNIPEAVRFRKLSMDVLGLNFNVLPGKNNNQLLGLQVDRFNTITLDPMGAGLSGALSLLIGLSGAQGKLFIIEEPEDDLHPKALKALLEAIAESSTHNQFLISTHSSIVLTKLGSIPGSVVINVASDGGLPPTSTFGTVQTTAERIDVMQDLGYGLADLDLGQGWLIFEESSAERLIRQWLIPWFAPGLGKLRTLAARGNSRVRPLMEDFREMLLFAHLEPVYRNRAWVIIDGDSDGVAIIAGLQEDFTGWPSSRFRHWTRKAFEQYYPAEFADRVEQVLTINDHRKQKDAKKELLTEVLAWIEANEAGARDEFETSASDVIHILRSIEDELGKSELMLHTAD